MTLLPSSPFYRSARLFHSFHIPSPTFPRPSICPFLLRLPMTLRGPAGFTYLLTCPYPPDSPYYPGGPENFSTLLSPPPYLPLGLMVRFGHSPTSLLAPWAHGKVRASLPRPILQPGSPLLFPNLLFAPCCIALPITLGGPGSPYLRTCPYPPDSLDYPGGPGNFST